MSELQISTAKETDEWSRIDCETTKGPMTWEVYRQWSPHGYDRVVDLMEHGFFDHTHFARVIPGFLCQFGIAYDEEKRKLGRSTIPDDEQLDPPIAFAPGILSYAGSGPDSRTSQMFISYGSAKSLGKEKWETPFGRVVEGMDHVEDFYSYGDMPPWGSGPEQQRMHEEGEAYMTEEFPLADKFGTCTVERHLLEEDEPAEQSEEPVDIVTTEDIASAQRELRSSAQRLRATSLNHHQAMIPALAGMLVLGVVMMRRKKTAPHKSV